MPVGHGGCMSKHPAWVKIAILEFLEARLKDAADIVDIGADNIQVWDPFTTEMDFYFSVNASWSKYLDLYGVYYNKSFTGHRQKEIEKDLPTRYGLEYAREIQKAIYNITNEEDSHNVFNASTSKTEIFYTIEEMKEILQRGRRLSGAT